MEQLLFYFFHFLLIYMLCKHDGLSLKTNGGKTTTKNIYGEEKKYICIDLEDNISTKRLTRRESFPEEILAAGFALAGSQHGTRGALHLQARALALRAARHLV